MGSARLVTICFVLLCSAATTVAEDNHVFLVGTTRVQTSPEKLVWVRNPFNPQQSGGYVQPAQYRDETKLYVVKKSGTASKSTELSVFTETDNFQKPVKYNTGLHETDTNWTFVLFGDDLACIHKAGAASKKTELHVLTASSSYKQFGVQVSTGLDASDNNYEFTPAGRDLACVIKAGTNSKTTELHILTASSRYKEFRTHAATGLNETGPTWQFIMSGEQLVGVKMVGGSAKTTELHTLSSASAYKEFLYHGATGLGEVDGNWRFGMTGPDLIAIKKSGTNSGKVELHFVRAGDGGYKTVSPAIPVGLPSIE